MLLMLVTSPFYKLNAQTNVRVVHAISCMIDKWGNVLQNQVNSEPSALYILFYNHHIQLTDKAHSVYYYTSKPIVETDDVSTITYWSAEDENNKKCEIKLIKLFEINRVSFSVVYTDENGVKIYYSYLLEDIF